MRFLKKIQINALVTAVLYLVLGLLFVLLPGVTMQTICYILAASLAIGGLAYVIDYFRTWDIEYRSNGLAIGILAIVASLFLFIKTQSVIEMIPILLGFAIIVSGVIKVQNVIVLYKVRDKAWIFVLITAILCLALGVILIENPFAAARTLVIIIGVGLLFSGITDLAIIILMSRRAKELKKSVRGAMAKPVEAVDDDE